MISSLVFWCVVGVVVVLFGAWLTGRHKTNLKRNPMEKLANTLEKRFNSCINDLNNSLKRPEDVQNEMLEALDDYKAEKVKEVKNLIVNLTQTETNIDSNIRSLINARENIKKNIATIKAQDNPDVNLGGSLMKQLENVEKSIDVAEKSKENIKQQVLNINGKVATFNTKIEIKRTEVLTLISTYVANSCNHTMKLDIDLSDLMSDYTTEMTIADRQAQVDAIVANKVTNKTEETTPQEYIDKFNNYKI